jgi:kumamolisin
MPNSHHEDVPIPNNYTRLDDSERRPSPKAKALGPADPNEIFSVTIVLRRKLGAQMRDFSHFEQRVDDQDRPPNTEEFAARYGASEEDAQKVVEFAKSHGLSVKPLTPVHLARRTVVAEGTVEQMSKAFAVSLGKYEHEVRIRRGAQPKLEVYRGRNGFIYVPKELGPIRNAQRKVKAPPIIRGVFGLDNRTIARHNSGDPPNTGPLTVPEVARLYDYPYPPKFAKGQTIGILATRNYDENDIKSYFASLPNGFPMPVVNRVVVHEPDSKDPSDETTHDISIAAAFAPGASINVYITSKCQQGWVDVITRVAHPDPDDTPCSVLSCSYYIADGDDTNALGDKNVSIEFLKAVHKCFCDPAIRGITVCVASGDNGTNSDIAGRQAHVQYPASDPWVLSVGGTTIGNVRRPKFDEYVWNDAFGATGGGISDFFPVPSYQQAAKVPPSLNDGAKQGRGVPDVAGNASPSSGYKGLIFNNKPSIGTGTSVAAPQWAALIAVINAALGKNVGFVNPALYKILRGTGFRDITGAPGPTDNSFGGTPGYPVVGGGWDACTGLGSPNGRALLEALRPIFTQ